jgi:hypothetical protein
MLRYAQHDNSFVFFRVLGGKMGSGSKYMIAGKRQVVFDNEPACHQMMHVFNLRERQGLANIPGEPLP